MKKYGKMYKAPEVEAPEVEAPEVEAPEVEAPEVKRSIQSGTEMLVDVHALALRQNPSKKALICNNGILTRGTVVNVISTVNDLWVRVNSGSDIGYVMIEYLMEV